MYVQGYGPIEPVSPARPFMRAEDIGVSYSYSPEWRVSVFHAEYELQTLRGMNVHVGEHYCDFELEELATDVFAIMCKSHPPRPARLP